MNDTETGEALFSELPWMIVYTSEGLLILAGNSIAVFIFMKIRNNLRRTSYLLINLTLADLLLSVAISLYLWEGIAEMRNKPVSLNVGNAAFGIDLLASTASLLSLSFISLERMLAILWPFRHRMLETWYYLASVGALWVLAVANVAVTSHLVFKGTVNLPTMGFSAIAFLSITVTAASYLAIWIAIKRNQLQNSTSRSLAQQKKLAKTLCIVTTLSLITWLPAGISLAFPTYISDSPSLYSQITLALQYANSFVNPVVYCFRMAEFQKALKELCCRCYTKRRSLSDGTHAWVSHGISLTSFKSADSDVSRN